MKKPNSVPQAQVIQENEGLRARVASLERQLSELDQAAHRRPQDGSFSRLHRAIPVPLILSRLEDGRFIDVNDSFLEFTGYLREEIIGRTAVELGLWADPDARARMVQRLLKDGTVRNMESTFCDKSGERRLGRLSSERVDIDGKACLLTVGEDITERTRATEALRESEERYRTLVQTMNEGLVVQDAEQRITYVNDRLCEIWGHPAERLIGRPVSAFFMQNVVRTLKKKWDARREGDQTPYELALSREDGKKVYCIISPRPMFDSTGKQSGSFAVVTDITDRKIAEAALKESERTLSTLLDNLPGMAYRCRNDRQWTMEFVSEGCVELTGHGPTDLIANRVLSYADLIHPEDREPVWRNVQAALDAVKPFRLVYRIRRADGRERWVWEQGRGVFSSDGTLLALEGFVTDITERKATETALQEAREELEVRVQARTADLAETNQRLKTEIAERGRAEEALRLTQFAVDHAADAIFWLDPDGRFFSVNDAACARLGYSRDELLTMSVPDIDPIYPAERWPEAFREFQKLGPTTIETVHRTKTGEEFPVEITVNPHEFGGRVFICAFARDITERKRAEEALRHSEERLQAILDNSTAVIYVKDVEGRYLLINTRYEQLFDVDRERLLGKTDYDIFPKESADAFRENDREVLRTGRALEIEERVPQAGHIRTFLSVQFPLKDPAGKIYAVCGISTDITERKEAENRIRRQALVLENMYDGVVLTDLEGRITVLNPSAERTMGYSRAELMGRSLETLFRPDEAAELTRRISQGIARRGRWSGEITLVRKDGSEVVCESLLVPFRDETGRQIGTVAVNRDLTERIRAEEAKAKLEQQLLRSQKMEAVGTLASGIAHEFDNLLMAISTYTDLAKASLPDDHRAVRTLEKVEQTAKQARGATDALLTFSHRAAVTKSTVNLSRSVKETTRLLARLLPSSIEIVEEISARENLWVRADEGQLQQILVNLALNARDAMPGGGTLKISLTSEAPGPDAAERDGRVTRSPPRAVLTVEDTGCGMSEEVLSRIFEPFFTTKPRGQGTGLGTSLTLGIVEDLEGTIDIASTQGKGTRVTIAVPCCDVPKGAERDDSPARRVDFEPGRMILVVEQNQHIRSIIISTLRARGYEVMAAADAAEAFERMRNRRQLVDMLVVDLDTADETSLAWWRKLKKLREDLPIVILAGTLSINLRHWEMEDGYLLRKPFQMADLASTVAEILGGTQDGGAAGE